MEAINQTIAQRCSEIENYLRMLERLENPEFSVVSKVTNRSIKIFGEDSFKVMKASVFLLVYNLVESSITMSFEAIYDAIERKDISFGEVREEYQELWLRKKASRFQSSSSTQNTFHTIAAEIANEILSEKILDKSSFELKVSGNLDARSIRHLCETHGISKHVHYRANNGVDLLTIKNQRNALGHGSLSFSECGQQYAVSDLKRIYQQARVYIRSVSRNVGRFVDNDMFVH